MLLLVPVWYYGIPYHTIRYPDNLTINMIWGGERAIDIILSDDRRQTVFYQPGVTLTLLSVERSGKIGHETFAARLILDLDFRH